jgi:nucleotide-binding universal stress UspA family protein
MAERRCPSPALRELWRDEAWQRLWSAFDAGLGGVPRDVLVEPTVVRGEPGPVLTDGTGEGDLLVIGTGRRGLVKRALHRSTGRYVLAHARCPVLAVPPSALMDAVGTGRKSWALRRHATVPDDYSA